MTVPDLANAEALALAQGLTIFNHADYEPGKRFYFLIDDNIEIEVISYQ